MGGIIADYPAVLYSLGGPDLNRMKSALETSGLARTVFLFGQHLHISLAEAALLSDLEGFLESGGYRDWQLEEITPGIEDCFLELV